MEELIRELREMSEHISKYGCDGQVNAIINLLSLAADRLEDKE